MGKSRQFSGKVRRANFNRICGIRLFPFLWVPKFRYSAGVVGYSKRQCEKIEKPVVSACLSASGINQKFPRAVVFCHENSGGLGWENMRQIQVYESIKLFLTHMKLDNELSKPMRNSLELEQLRQGKAIPILEAQQESPQYAEKSWIVNLQNLLAEQNMSIKLVDQWLPSIQRKNDKILMEILTENCTNEEQISVNACRLYLQSNSLADIV